MILSNDPLTLELHKHNLMRTFKMKDLSPIHWFLGLEITQDQAPSLISVSQTQYVSNVISCFGFSNSCPTSTPFAVHFKLPLLDYPEIDAHDYQSHFGSIMYAMLGTCPDIAYAVGTLSQFLANPGVNTVNQLL